MNPNDSIISPFLKKSRGRYKKMKLPNHFGTVTKLSGNRRNPWVAREGKSGKQRPIGYAATREEALLLLSKYNDNPWDIDTSKITMQQLFDLWVEKKMPKLGKSNCASLKAAYKHCNTLHNHQYSAIKAFQMQDCIDNCGLSASSQVNIKNLILAFRQICVRVGHCKQMLFRLTHNRYTNAKTKGNIYR